jgi:hypothetical protein
VLKIRMLTRKIAVHQLVGLHVWRLEICILISGDSEKFYIRLMEIIII